MRLGELCSSNPLRIPHPKIDKLACQAQGVGIFAKGEIPLRDAYCEHFYLVFRFANYLEKVLEGILFCTPRRAKTSSASSLFDALRELATANFDDRLLKPLGRLSVLHRYTHGILYHRAGGLSIVFLRRMAGKWARVT